MTLQEIQQKLKAPKNQLNKFGGYNYRNCEDILEAVKPLLGECNLLLTDTIEHIGDRYYVKATARFFDGLTVIETTAFAREEETKKGMDCAQITGAASSYARKYALNGLFLIDDTKDADHDSSKDSSRVEKKAAVNDEPDVPLSIAEPNLTNFQTVTRYIKEVTGKKGKTNGKAWTLYFVNDEDGGSYATFNADLADVATDCARQHILVKVTYQSKEKGNNLISLMPEGIDQ